VTRKLTVDHVDPPSNGYEYFVVGCSLGQFLYSFFSMIANFGTSEKICDTKYCFLEEIMNALEIAVHITFYFYAKKAQLALKESTDCNNLLFHI
jgi:hypothetical protein